MPGTAILGLDPLWLSTAILIGTYLALMTERLNRAIVAGVGACLMITTGVLDQESAIAGVDFNTIMLLAGMMMIVAISRRSGMFQAVALWTVRLAKGRPAGILIGLALATGVVSAFLDNVTTVLLIVPVTLAITRELQVPPYPFLFAQVVASNVGGTATLIGDPPNILVGSAADLSFNEFVLNLGPVVIVLLLIVAVTVYWASGRHVVADEEHRRRVLAMSPASAITDVVLLRQSLAVLAGVVIAFVFARRLHLEAGTIAMTGAVVLVLLDNYAHPSETQTERVQHIFSEVEWITLFFFIGLFVVVAGVEHAGLLHILADELLAATHGNFAITVGAVLWGSALLSAFVDNIPFVATMIPLIKALAPELGGDGGLEPLWWALALGACLGGNGTLVGASANLTVAGLAERAGIPFRFWPYTRRAFGLMVLTVALAHAYLAWRYL